MWTILALAAAAAGAQGAPSRADLNGIFSAMDRDGNGFVTADESPRVTNVRSRDGTRATLRIGGDWIARYDANGDGRVGRGEFLSAAEAEIAAYARPR